MIEPAPHGANLLALPDGTQWTQEELKELLSDMERAQRIVDTTPESLRDKRYPPHEIARAQQLMMDIRATLESPR